LNFYSENRSGEGSCKVVTALSDAIDFRLNGSLPIKGGFNASFIYRNTRGAAQNATLAVAPANVTFKPRADGTVRPSSSLQNVGAVVNLVTPNSQFGDRFSQLDLAVSKNLNIGWGNLRLAFDLYNALNSNSIQNVTTAYGARWLRPATFLDPRLARVTAALQF
jgi:hypothetical protein